MSATARLKLGEVSTPMRPLHPGLQVREGPAGGADHQVGAGVQGPVQVLRAPPRRRWRRRPGRPRSGAASPWSMCQASSRSPAAATSWAMAEPSRPRPKIPTFMAASCPDPGFDQGRRAGPAGPAWRPPACTTMLRLISLAPMLIISTLMSRRAPKHRPVTPGVSLSCSPTMATMVRSRGHAHGGERGQVLEQGLQRRVGVHGEGDAHLGGGDQVDADPVAGEHLEQAGQEAALVEHVGRGDGEHGDRAALGQGGDGPAGAHFGGDGGEAAVGPPGVAHGHRDAGLHRRLDGGGVQHLGAEGGQFRRLGEAQLGDGLGLGHDPRVAGEHALHVGPDLDVARRPGRRRTGRRCSRCRPGPGWW